MANTRERAHVKREKTPTRLQRGKKSRVLIRVSVNTSVRLSFLSCYFYFFVVVLILFYRVHSSLVDASETEKRVW